MDECAEPGQPHEKRLRANAETRVKRPENEERLREFFEAIDEARP